MPSNQQNYETWNHAYDWSRYQGDEWSAKWGGPDMQWHWCILPRIRHHLPAKTILDIGPGFGRWTKYLLDYCEKMILVDISERCIHACKERFGEEKITYRVGPGDSIDFLEDASIDFAFSWETLVYTEREATENYLRGLSQKLKPKGSAFLHHSNLGSYEKYFRFTLNRVPKSLRDFLKKRKLLDYDQWRAQSVTAELFRELAEQHELQVYQQELIPWGGKRLIDCFSTLGRGKREQSCKVQENPHFHSRAYEIQHLSWLYGEGVPW